MTGSLVLDSSALVAPLADAVRWAAGSLRRRPADLRAAPHADLLCASYVALAEMLRAPLVTLDLRLDRASGPRCAVLTPGQEGSE